MTPSDAEVEERAKAIYMQGCLDHGITPFDSWWEHTTAKNQCRALAREQLCEAERMEDGNG